MNGLRFEPTFLDLLNRRTNSIIKVIFLSLYSQLLSDDSLPPPTLVLDQLRGETCLPKCLIRAQTQGLCRASCRGTGTQGHSPPHLWALLARTPSLKTHCCLEPRDNSLLKWHSTV